MVISVNTSSKLDGVNKLYIMLSKQKTASILLQDTLYFYLKVYTNLRLVYLIFFLHINNECLMESNYFYLIKNYDY